MQRVPWPNYYIGIYFDIKFYIAQKKPKKKQSQQFIQANFATLNFFLRSKSITNNEAKNKFMNSFTHNNINKIENSV